MTPDNGWDAHKRLIEYRLDKNEEAQKKLFDKMEEVHEAVREIRSSRKVLVASISAGTSVLVTILGLLFKAFIGK